MNKDKNVTKKMNPEEIPTEFLALCPLDGRYARIGRELSPYFSEYALMKNRVKVEVYWLQFLLENIGEVEELENFDKSNLPKIISIYEDFSADSIKRIKEIEKETNHDVKAVEFFVDEKLKELGFESLISFVHLGCTSEDINNTSMLI